MKTPSSALWYLKSVTKLPHYIRSFISSPFTFRRYDEAVEDCRKAIEMDSSNGKAYVRGAKAELALGENLCARKFYGMTQIAVLAPFRSRCTECPR